MIIGIPREIMAGEARVAATPETVKMFIADGMTVLVESGAGEKSLFADAQYKEAGAEIVNDVQQLFERAELIMKVKEPLMNEKVGKHEVEMMRKDQMLITFIHPASPVNHDMVRMLAEKGVNSMTLDSVPRISRAQEMDALTSMSTCAGYKGIMMAANELPVFMPQLFTAVGVIRPAQVLVIGSGVAGLQALATARRLGAVTHAMDIRPAANEQATSLAAKVIETGVPEKLAVGEGGYAQKLPEEWLEKERKVLAEVLKNMDIVFCSALIPGKIAPILITEEMVKAMPKGSVIVDVSIDQGGNCELTVPGKSVEKHGVIIQGIKNLPGLIPTTSTMMFSKNVYSLVKYLAPNGTIDLNMDDDIMRSILVTKDGEIVHGGTREAMKI